MRASYMRLLGVSFILLLCGCESFLGKKEKVPIEGKRETVLLDDILIRPDRPEQAQMITLPQTRENEAWPMASGNAQHTMDPVALGDNPARVWRFNIGRGFGSASRLLNGPVIAEGKVFAVDAEGEVSAVDLKTGVVVWETSTRPEEGISQAFSGGLVYDKGRIYVATSAAEAVALDAEDGKLLWRKKITAPVRSAPTVQDGRVFVVTINNKLEALEGATGKLLWSHSGIIETAGLLGGASPAVYGGVVVVTYSSGEIFALRAENGFPLWSESLSAFNRLDSVSSLAHIKARPVIKDGRVFLISHSGRTSALDLRTGKRIWTRNFGGIRSPAVAGDYIFMLTNENNLLCMTQREGWILWAARLPRFKDEEKRDGKILWAGPILVEDQLVLSGSNGQAIFVSARDGKTLKTVDLSDETVLSPIVADKTLVFLTSQANLVAYR